MDDPYRMLQVGVDADIEEVKDAYWELATPHHLVLAAADAGRRRTGDDAEVAEARSALTRLDAAYAVLADPATRAHYDREQHGVERSGQAAVLAGEPEDPGPARDPLDAPSAGGWPTQPSCVVCGGRPAVPAVLREVTGMILRYRVDRLREALCADCGTATFRRMQARTLLRGWWGLLALFHNYSVVATNWVMARRFAALPPPQRPGSWPDGSPRPALEPGAPLWRRPTLLLGGLVLLALVGAAVVDTFG